MKSFAAGASPSLRLLQTRRNLKNESSEIVPIPESDYREKHRES
jgi:hypothetical protein